MAIYPFDYTSYVTVQTGLKNGLDSAGILTTVHRETTTNLIVTISRCPGVLRFYTPGSMRLYCQWGTSWSSGDAVVGAVVIQASNNGVAALGSLIVTGDVVYVAEQRGSMTAGTLIGNLDNEDETAIAWGFASTNNNPDMRLYNITSGQNMGAAFHSRRIVSADGYYYTSNIPAFSNADILLAPGVRGARALHKAVDISSAYEIAGDDVVVPLGATLNNASYAPCSLCIPNGASWTPT